MPKTIANMTWKLQYKLSNTVTFVALISLFFSVTNLIYVSAVASAIILVLLPLFSIALLKAPKQGIEHTNQPQPRNILIAALTFYLFAIFSMVLIEPKAFLNFRFYRYDANFILSYAAFLLLPFYTNKLKIQTVFICLIVFVALMQIPAMLYEYTHGNYTAKYRHYYSLIVYFPFWKHLFSSTSAAAGFYSIISALCFARWHTTRSNTFLAIFLFLLLCIFFTTSRTSALAIISGIVAWQFCRIKQLKLIPIVSIIAILLIEVSLTHKYLHIHQAVISADQYIQEQQPEITTVKSKNIYRRLINYWPPALERFIENPLLGSGFSTYNDRPNITFNDQHAHNSYLHIAAEQGLIGLLIVLSLWYWIYGYIHTLDQHSWIKNGLQIAFWSILYSSCAGHRLTTPAMIIPFSLILLLYSGYCMGEKQLSSAQTSAVE